MNNNDLVTIEFELSSDNKNYLLKKVSLIRNKAKYIDNIIIEVPSVYEGKPVVGIKSKAFKNLKKVLLLATGALHNPS